MTQTRNRNRCMDVQCTAPLETRTSACARCAVVRYCSKEVDSSLSSPPSIRRICRHSPVPTQGVAGARPPHRTLHKSIHILRSEVGLLDAAEWDGWLCYEVPNRTNERTWKNLVNLCQTKNVDPALSDTIDSEITIQGLPRYATIFLNPHNAICTTYSSAIHRISSYSWFSTFHVMPLGVGT